MENASMMWKTAKEPTPLELLRTSLRQKDHGHCLWAPVWTPVPRISSTKDDCHFGFVFRYPCRIANDYQGKASHNFDSRSHLHHNNTLSHTASLTQTLAKNMKWKILKHSLYYQDFAPSDFHTFPLLKGNLGGKYFKMEEELKSAVKIFF